MPSRPLKPEVMQSIHDYVEAGNRLGADRFVLAVAGMGTPDTDDTPLDVR